MPSSTPALDIRSKQIALYLKRLSHLLTDQQAPLTATFAHSVEPIPLKDSVGLDRTPIQPGDTWGHEWESGYFRFTGTIPKDWAGAPVVCQIDLGGEALIYDAAGTPLYGLTNGSVFDKFFSKDLHFLLDACSGNDSVEIYAEAAGTGIMGLDRSGTGEITFGKRFAEGRHGTFHGTLNKARLCKFNPELWDYYNDVRFLYNLYLAVPKESVRGLRIMKALHKAMAVFDESEVNVKAAKEILEPELEKPANASALTSPTCGHAHIDTGWLWPVRESVRKCARTFSSQVSNIERYPGYVFGISQPQHLTFVKEHYPELFAKIKHHIAEGNIECQGGMWVEADNNVPSGESLVRQVLHGKNFWMDEFGKDVKNLWLPDVFGYSAALPQILKRSGIDYFLTQKLSWSEFTRFPHQTFIWEGIDGNQVITHFPPENTYNSQLDPQGMVKSESRFVEKGFLDEYLTLFGVGDGGGGPRELDIESGLRMQNCEGVSKMTFDHAQNFFDRLSEKAGELEVWNGELYLEFHRATLTTQAKTKWYNRTCENRLRAMEALCSCLPASEWPEEFDALWKVVLINQFHDILPGSSIRKVYEATERELQEVLDSLDSIEATASASLLTDEPGAVTALNIMGSGVTAVVEIPEATTSALKTPTQQVDETWVTLTGLPGTSFTDLTEQSAPAATPAVTAEQADGLLVLENDSIRYELDQQGQVTRAFDKEQDKEIIDAETLGNVFSLYHDYPSRWDAWDIDFNYGEFLTEQSGPITVTSVESGPVLARVVFEMQMGDSTIQQDIRLAAHTKQLDFHTHVDWKEMHKMLRVHFGVNIHTDEATFDIQYGTLKRTTHAQRLFEKAMFETAGHKFADLSEDDYGVALMNTCKYGYHVYENVLDLNLLRASTAPDPDADYGQHSFTYSFLPHEHALEDSNVYVQAELLNNPPLVFPGKKADRTSLPASLDSRGITLDVIKKAEKEDCLVIRLVERLGNTSPGTLSFPQEVTLVETDLMEWKDGERQTISGLLNVTLKPFEIRTYKVYA